MDKQLLFTERLPKGEVTIPDLGTFHIRGLSRAEIKMISEGTDAGKDMEPWILSNCLLDPTLTEDEAKQWLAIAPFGEIEKLTEEINKLSGIAKYAGKEAYKSVRDGSDA